MKHKVALLLIAFFVLLFNCTAHVYGIDLGVETETLSQEKKETLFASSDIKLLTEEGIRRSVACFDVNEDGLVAIGFDVSPRPQVYLYDSNGQFLYGYEFECMGSYGIKLIGNNLAIYFVRSDYIEIYDAEGNGIDAMRVPNTEANRAWKSDMIDPVEIEVNGNTYSLERDIGLIMRSYSRLVRLDEQGNRTVLYDVSVRHNIGVVIGVILFVGFVSLLTVVLIRQQRDRQEKDDSAC